MSEAVGSVVSFAPHHRAGLVAVVVYWFGPAVYSGGKVVVSQRRDGEVLSEWTVEGVESYRSAGEARRTHALLLRGEGKFEPGDVVVMTTEERA